MKTLKFLSLLFLAMFLCYCESSTKASEHDAPSIESKDEIDSKVLSANEQWMQSINKKDLALLETLYIENVYVLSKNGVDISDRNSLLELVKDSDFGVTDVRTIKKIKANSVYDYEIGSFKNKDGQLMKHLIIWKNSVDGPIRELEFLDEADASNIDLGDIEAERTQWMAMCNAHDAKTLIENMYTEYTMYYNNGRLLKGRDNLTVEYQYMNNPKYNLTLEPILVEPVSKTIVYEFGQCKGSYNGKYILVWQKNNEGRWQILFDSNI